MMPIMNLSLLKHSEASCSLQSVIARSTFCYVQSPSLPVDENLRWVLKTVSNIQAWREKLLEACKYKTIHNGPGHVMLVFSCSL